MRNNILIEGNAGTGKTFSALQECIEESKITIIRNIEPVGNKGIGFLPGDVDEKLAPFFELYDELLKKIFNYNSAFLVKKGRVQFLPTAFLRGRTLEGTVILDEAQNMNTEELETVLTRIGKYGRLIVVGDIDQCDIGNGDDYYNFTDTFLKCDSVEHVVLEKNWRSPLLTEYFYHKGET